ncbi:MAG: hypothetical protein IJI14_15955 [Anaerolineaceae bacterium]|nr:hypothetical protein [Anaerolineaceae bacterium]
MKYGYSGSFKTAKENTVPYRPSEVQKYFYCHVYPEVINEITGKSCFGGEVIRVRVTPVGVDKILIAGHKEYFFIRPYNSEYYLLENDTKRSSQKKKYLITVSTVKENHLQRNTQESPRLQPCG